MPGNFKNDDSRVKKTLKAIHEALIKLLGCRSFERMTVNELCEEAQISRPTFYKHYKDKYDLLESWLANVSERIKINKGDGECCAQAARITNILICENSVAISNLLKDASNETLDLLYAFMLSLIDVAEKKDDDGSLSPQYIVFSNFCAGGMMKLLTWQVNNESPQNSQISTHFLSLITHILAWEAMQDYQDGSQTSDEKLKR